MIQARQLLSNVVVSGLQVVVVGVAYFVLYPFLIRVLGDELFGLWTLVLATTTATNLANLGLAGSMVKFVAKHLAREDEARARLLVETALLSLAVVLGVVLLASYPLFVYVLDYLVSSKTPALVDEAVAVLPYALSSFWLTSMAGVALSSLEGCHRVDRRGLLTMMAAVLYLGLGIGLTLTDGLMGLALAQVLQAGALLVAAWVTLRYTLPGLPFLPFRWSWEAFREMLSYSVNYQVISLAQLLVAPVTSALLTRFGGVALAGYFELANRLVIQVRALIVTAYQAIVPTIADLHERSPEAVRGLYHTSLGVLQYLVIPALALLLLATPYLSALLVGRYQPDFVLYTSLLLVGWFINILTNPAYFAYMGIGLLRWNVAGHLLTGGLNALLGLALGAVVGDAGVMAALAVALVAGSLVPVVAYHREQRIAWSSIGDKPTAWLLGITLVAAVAALGVHQGLATWALWERGPLVALVFGLIVLPALWRHPVRSQVLAWVRAATRPSPSLTDS